MIHSPVVKTIYGAQQSLVALVKGVVIGRKHHIETGIDKSIEVTVGRTETWIAGIRFSGNRSLKINYSIIGGIYVCLDCGEALRVVMHTVISTSGINLRLMLHGIAGKYDISPGPVSK